jgi:hypothetical protein
VNHFNATLQLHDAATTISSAALRSSNSGAAHVVSGMADTKVIQWTLPATMKRSHGSEMRLTGTITTVTRMAVAPSGLLLPFRASAELQFALLLATADGHAFDRSDASPVSPVEVLPVKVLRTHHIRAQGASSLERASNVFHGRTNMADNDAARVVPKTTPLSLSTAVTGDVVYATRVDAAVVLDASITRIAAESLSFDSGASDRLRVIASPPQSSGRTFSIWNCLDPNAKVL